MKNNEKSNKMIKKNINRNNFETLFLNKKSCIFLISVLFFAIFSTKSAVFDDFLPKKQIKLTNKTKNPSFQGGEKLKYKISYGLQNSNSGLLFAAHAYLHAKDSITNDSVPVYSLSAQGKTNRVFSWFMKVNHQYRTILDANHLHTIEHKMDIEEGKFFNKEHVFFNEDSSLWNLKTNDILGAGYRLRTIPPDQLALQDTVFFSYYYDGIVYSSYLLNLGEEIINTRFGKLKTIKCSPLLEKGRMFKQETGAYVWVTADEMHIPVKIELPILVGSVYVTLSSYENTLFDIRK
jgi:hypothetical protein